MLPGVELGTCMRCCHNCPKRAIEWGKFTKNKGQQTEIWFKISIIVLVEEHSINIKYAFVGSAREYTITNNKENGIAKYAKDQKRGDITLTQLLPFELFSKKFCLNISELGLEIV